MMLSQLDSTSSGMWLLLFVLAMVTGSLWILRRRTDRQPVTRLAVHEKLEQAREQSRMRRSMDDLLLQLEDLSRRINAHVDTKFTKLETVVRDADDRIRRLEQLLAQAPAESKTSNNTPPNSAAPPPHRDRSAADGESPAADDHRSASPRPATTPTPQPPAASTTISPATFEPLTPQHRRICELADGGATASEIAESMNVMLGEVELILSLRQVK